MMLGPHIAAGSPETRSISARSVLPSARRWGSGTASRKSSTDAAVALVLFSAIRSPLVAIGPARRVRIVDRRDRRDEGIAVATIADTLRMFMAGIVERGARRPSPGQPEWRACQATAGGTFATEAMIP